jgi:hypothetical protein
VSEQSQQHSGNDLEETAMSLRYLKCWLLVSLFAFAPGAVLAATVHLTADLDGAQANAGAGTGSPGTGFATMTFDTASSEFNWDISWSGLLDTETAAHFHGPALPGQNAGIEVTIDHTTNPSIGMEMLDADQSNDLLAGLWYINIHTEFAPDGEIRGQVQVIPIPASVWLFVSGLLGLIGIGRRRARTAWRRAS